MASASSGDAQKGYLVSAGGPRDLTEAEMARCVTIVTNGEAVDPASVEIELPQATVLAIVRKGQEIVGLGAIKRVRIGYAAKIAERSGHEFPPETPELGYVARVPGHRGNRLAARIVKALLLRHEGALWATTDSEGMKAALSDAGFERKGKERKGARGQLSLWIRG